MLKTLLCQQNRLLTQIILFRRYHVVTHVFVNDAARGYAVSIQDMLQAAELAMDRAV